jgi:hypothetical protein
MKQSLKKKGGDGMIKKLEPFISECDVKQKINEIIRTINLLSGMVNLNTPLNKNGTWIPGTIVDEDIDPIFFDVNTPPPLIKQRPINLISELEDRLCR